MSLNVCFDMKTFAFAGFDGKKNGVLQICIGVYTRLDINYDLKKKKKTPAITSGKPVNNKFFARDFLLFFTHNLTYKIHDVLCKLRNN
jgi:hypothetical protein